MAAIVHFNKTVEGMKITVNSINLNITGVTYKGRRLRELQGKNRIL